MLKALKLHDLSERSPLGFWLCLAFLFLVVLTLHGKTVPYNNEFIYLLRLVPNFLPNDWSFSQSANEHWLFNSIFSIPANFLSIEAVGWMGRITFWILCLAGLLKLGKLWEISNWAIVFSISLWLAIGQSVVNAEWIFGTFEAKTVSYACLLFALVEFSKQRIILPSVLLGLCFSFHPAVGLWAIVAVGMALLVERLAIKDLIKVVGLTLIFSLLGILPLLSEQAEAAAASLEDWQFVVTKHMPYHFDPFYFSKMGIVLLGLMLVFNLFALWKNKSFALRFMLSFQIVIALFFVLGVILRVLEIYPLLRFMPMRLFPILTPLFFILTAFYFVPLIGSRRYKSIAALFVAAVIGLLSPFDEGTGQMRDTVESWRTKPDDFETSLVWISKNTPKDAVVIASPVSRKLWFLSNRAQIVSYIYPRYDRLTEWRKHIADVTGNAEITDRASSRSELDAGFDQLSVSQIKELKQKYSASYLLGRTLYPFPVIFETETYKVYQLP